MYNACAIGVQTEVIGLALESRREETFSVDFSEPKKFTFNHFLYLVLAPLFSRFFKFADLAPNPYF
jgi:hypothetical protein